MHSHSKTYYWGLLCSALALCLMMLGAYTRLSDAGLGCPDWPACYGKWLPDAAHELQHSGLALRKAWTEMIHRYVAGLLGFCILGFIIALFRKKMAVGKSLLLGLLLVLQALLGMWTVTLKLQPWVVMGHLLGGMSILGLLWTMTANIKCFSARGAIQNTKRMRYVLYTALFMLIAQIILGGLTSAHYAALVCPDFPMCHAHAPFYWDWHSLFRWNADAPGGAQALSAEARMTLHMLHRIGALCTSLLISYAAWCSWQAGRRQQHSILSAMAMVLMLLLISQIILGMSNVLFILPLGVAVAHHAVAALLLITLITLIKLQQQDRSSSPPLQGVECVSTRGAVPFEDYLTLCKPKVVLLMLLTAWVGMCLASETALPWTLCLAATIGIAACSAAAAVLNHVIDRKLDAQMQRTHSRPLAQARIPVRHALCFALCLSVLGFGILIVAVNALSAWLTFGACMGYALVYSVILKHRTPQNIVIGGMAGAMPPLLGWVAIRGELHALAWLPVLIIFAWTPPHFWALAIARQADYRQAQVPMLPITHGVDYTKLSMLLYTLLLIATSLLPYAAQLSGAYYLILALSLGAGFLVQVLRLYHRPIASIARQTFHYSIVYLFLLFVALLLDHYF